MKFLCKQEDLSSLSSTHIKVGCGDTQLLSQAIEEETGRALGLTNQVGQVPERNPISRNKKIELEVERTCRELWQGEVEGMNKRWR